MKCIRFILFSLFCLQHLPLISFTQSSKSFPNATLWRITGKGMKQPSYLFGTLHLKDRRIFHFIDSLYIAIEKTEGFALELSPDEMSGELTRSFFSKDTSGYVKDEVEKETYDRIRKKLERRFGSRIDRLTRRQLLLSRNEWLNEVTNENDMQTFMDAYLYQIARQQGKWIGGIENIEDQMNNLLKEMDGANLNELFPDFGNLKKSLDEIIEVYLSGNVEKIYEFTKRHDNKIQHDLLVQRNRKMAVKIDSLLQYRSTFFAVGAAHLAGGSGLIELLSQYGYKVEPVFSALKIQPEEYKIKSTKDFWKTFYPADSSYSVRYPSGTGTLYMSEQLVKMEMCFDLPTSTYYISASFPNLSVEKNTEKLLEEMVKGFTNQGKVLEKRKLDLNGMKGLELVIGSDFYFKVRAYVSDAYGYMLVMGHDSNKEVLKGEYSSKFFSSFQPAVKPVLTATGWREFQQTQLAFSVAFPGNPSVAKPDVSGEWIVQNFSSGDAKSQVFFMVNVKSTTPGYYLGGDSSYFSLTMNNWVESGYQKLTQDYFQMGEYAGMRFDMIRSEGKEKTVLRTMTVNRGNRSYLLVAGTAIGNENNPAIDRFFQSFRLLDYAPTEWKLQYAPDSIYSAFVPDVIRKKNLKKEEDDKDSWIYMAYDSATAVTYEMQKFTFADYYYGSSDSTIFSDALATIKEDNDSVIVQKMTQNGSFKSQEVILQLEGSPLKRRMRMILNEDTVYAIYAFLHPSLIDNRNVNQFFEEFQLNSKVVATTLDKRKMDLFFNDLWSGDSLRFVKAASRMSVLSFTKEDIPFIKEALLKQYDYAEDDFTDIYYDLADELYNIQDSTIIPFIKKNYFSLKVDNEAQRIAMLRLLTLISTKESYTVLKELLLEQPPNSSFLYPIKQFITDSLDLAATLFPDIMRLSNDSVYCEFVSFLANRLLDSGKLAPSLIQPYEKNLIEIAEFIYEKFKVNTEDVYYYYPSLRLLARMKSLKGNEILFQLAGLKIHTLNGSLIPELLMNGQSLSNSLLEETAADLKSRFLFYRGMEDRKLEKRFPEKYRTQKMIAESDVYGMASAEYEVKEIVYLQMKKRVVNGEVNLYYLFKVKTEEGWFLGISGGYNADLKIVGLSRSGDDGGIYWSETFSAKNINEQFEAFFTESELE